MLLKKFITFIMCVAILFSAINCRALEISGKSGILIERQTGRVLFEKNADARQGMASTTKIMTAIVALEHGNLQSIATVSSSAANTEGSSLYLKPLEKMTVENLLYGLMLSSGNDASVVLGEHISGSVYAFCELMNKKAKNLGLENTSFENPNGLNSEKHYSTARDMANLTRYALNNDKFREIVSSKNKVIKSQSGENDRYIKNHNKLLWNYEGATGVKTGFTKKDGRCLVSSASRGGIDLICVTLNAPNDWSDHAKMLDYGFKNLKRKKLVSKGAKVKNIEVHNGVIPIIPCEIKEDFYLPLKDNDETEIKYILPTLLEAPVKKGQEIGSAECFLNGEKVGEVKIISSIDVEVTNKIKVVQRFINLIINVIH